MCKIQVFYFNLYNVYGFMMAYSNIRTLPNNILFFWEIIQIKNCL